MKRICILLLVMILAALLLFGCKGNTPVSSEDSSLPESGASSAPEPVTPDETPVLRTLLRIPSACARGRLSDFEHLRYGGI